MTDVLLGRQLANFRLERLLGQGGMAQVYYGWDVKLQRPVAVKVIDVRFRGDPDYARRFVREAQAVATWRHENIAQVYYADEEGDLYYFVMEYLDGLDLSYLLLQYAAQGELMPQAEVARIGWAVARALDYAHQKGVIHRDVKPANVMVTQEGQVVLSDFGLALDVRQGSLGEVFGTAHYIAPEQARRSSAAVPQSDLYSLGVMLYEMLTGVVPFDDPSPTAVALQHLTQPPPPPRQLNPNLNEATESVLLKALNKAPADRYQTGAALLTALEQALPDSQPGDLAVVPPLPPLPASVQPLRRLSRTTVTSLIAARLPTAPASVSSPVLPAARPKKKAGPGWVWGAAGLVVMLGLIVAGGVCVSQAGNLGALLPRSTLAQLATLLPTQPAVAATPLPSRPTPSLQPSETAPAVAPPSETATGLPSPTELSTIMPAPVTAVPTVKYPGGLRFVLYYNETSLYLLNASQSIVDIPYVAFERLGPADAPANRFNGSRWWKYYPTSKPTWCMALKILGSSAYLEPPACGHDQAYLSVVTPTRTDAGLFWTPQADSSQFRVLWTGSGQAEEVARCEIAAGICEVFFP